MHLRSRFTVSSMAAVYFVCPSDDRTLHIDDGQRKDLDLVECFLTASSFDG